MYVHVLYTRDKRETHTQFYWNINVYIGDNVIKYIKIYYKNEWGLRKKKIRLSYASVEARISAGD